MDFGFNYSKFCSPNRNPMECHDIEIHRNVWREKGKLIVQSQRCGQRDKATSSTVQKQKNRTTRKKNRFSCPVVFCSNIPLHLDIYITCRKKGLLSLLISSIQQPEQDTDVQAIGITHCTQHGDWQCCSQASASIYGMQGQRFLCKEMHKLFLITCSYRPACMCVCITSYTEIVFSLGSKSHGENLLRCFLVFSFSLLKMQCTSKIYLQLG